MCQKSLEPTQEQRKQTKERGARAALREGHLRLSLYVQSQKLV
jgi:hypothetical protein